MANNTTFQLGNSGTRDWTITFDALPANVGELQKLPIADLLEPQNTAALTVAALCVYTKNKEATFEMLNFLKGPQPLSPYEKQFLSDRLRDKSYLPYSFFVGATPENNYTPNQPLTITILETPHSQAQASEGYVQLYIRSGGADSPRPIKMRLQPSTGKWFMWEQMLLSEIRIPKSDDAWA